MGNIVGCGEWNVEAVKAEILGWIGDSAANEPDEDGRVEFSIYTVTSGANGIHQPSDIFASFNMLTPPEWIAEHPGEDYDPDEDEWIWEDIDSAASDEAKAITDALQSDPEFCKRIDSICDQWGLYFGHRDTDGDYCLFFWYTVPEAE